MSYISDNRVKSLAVRCEWNFYLEMDREALDIFTLKLSTNSGPIELILGPGEVNAQTGSPILYQL